MKAALLTTAFFAALAAASFAEMADEGAALFEARCALCHQLPDPAMLKPQQWASVLTVMQKRNEQKGMPMPSENEMKAIREFLYNNARR